MQSLGYRHAMAVLSGESSLEQAIEDCKIKTRQYAKRQWTWFRREADVNWFKGFGTESQIQEQAHTVVANFVGNED
jgi:tRNA dimethylallyltransferase